MARLQLEIVTPDRLVLSQEVDYVGAPGVEGEFGLLPEHVPFLSALTIGTLYYKVDNKTFFVFIAGGFAEVSANTVTILAEIAEIVSEIDAQRAESAYKRAQQRQEEARQGRQAEKYDAIRTEAALSRAVTRLASCDRARQAGTL